MLILITYHATELCEWMGYEEIIIKFYYRILDVALYWLFPINSNCLKQACSKEATFMNNNEPCATILYKRYNTALSQNWIFNIGDSHLLKNKLCIILHAINKYFCKICCI